MNDATIKKINSITKYPSILTYHEMGEKGKLKQNLNENKEFLPSEGIYVYEKVDGENSRIIFINNEEDEADYLIGSREEILYAKDDRVFNPSGNMVPLLKPLADKLCSHIFKDKSDVQILVMYQESYGGKTTKAKNYANSKTQHYQLFDVMEIKMDDFDTLFRLELQEIALWRENENQPFYNETEKANFIFKHDLSASPLLYRHMGQIFPKTIEDTFNFLSNFKTTHVGIDVVEGKSEGIIVRNKDRSMIRKIRFEDYERTLQNKK